MSNSIRFTLPLCLLCAAAATAQEYSIQMESIQIIGTREDARAIPGSGAVIEERQIRIEAASDINQLLKTIPGTYIREEEGLGLRPNIGIRAATSERSGKVTLMEDGVLIAPAPYADPAAYYFPTVMRLKSVEVLKGAPLLRHGPQTTGGVINLISTPIPETRSGEVTAIVGQNSSRDLSAYYGGRGGNFGWLVETVQRSGDGFKRIDRNNRDAGYDIQDYLVKFGWDGANQSLLFKAQYSEETSNETYLGLTDTDFRSNPNRRYGLSAIDQMDNQHQGYSLTYQLELGDRTTLTAVGYHNVFARNWFKLDGGGSLVNAANAGDANAQAILNGTADRVGLRYKHNSRDYQSTGLELNALFDLAAHSLNLGGRIHQDESDRFQPVEIYNQINGILVFQGINQPGSSDNRVESVDAFSFWITDSWQFNNALNINLALRYEDVQSARVQYADVQRSTVASRSSNDTRIWLPGASFTYELNDSWQLLAGLHKGFSPLGGSAAPTEKPETSINYEAGARFNRDSFFAEAILFVSDFDNKAENCSLATPCSNGATSGSFITGEAQVSGLEIQLSNQFALKAFQVPVTVAYTYTQAEITRDNPTTGFAEGDRLADIPENIFSLTAGLEHPSGWNNYLVAKYIDQMCVHTGCDSGNRLEHSQSLWVLDLISRYQINASTLAFFKVDNLLDERAIVSRKPDGARPNKPQTAMIGLEYRF